MKRLIYIIAALFVLGFAACKKVEDAPENTTDERLNETMSQYQTQLTEAKYGWRGYLLAASEVTATFLFSFNDKNRVVMSASFMADDEESSYRLKALQRPTLIFDTYSTLHLLSDPDPFKAGGRTGAGYYADFEFAFVKSSPDTITLEGTFNGSTLILVRSQSADENTNAFNDEEVMTDLFSSLRTYFKRSTINDVEYEVNLNPSLNLFGLSYLENGELKKLQTSYYVTGKDLNFFKPIQLGNLSITGVKNLSFNPSGFISGTLNGGANIEIREAIKPMKYDVTAAARFHANPVYGVYSECYDGWTVDGQLDYYNLRSVTDFYSLDYYPKVPNQTYGAVRYWIRGKGYGGYGIGFTPEITPEGILKLEYVGRYGVPPPAIATIINNTNANFLQPEGFYVMQISAQKYDMVSVRDARSWITFE